MKSVIQHFLEHDPPLGAIAEQIGPIQLEQEHTDPFFVLVKSIVFQQLAGPAARATFDRLQHACSNSVTADQILVKDSQQLRECGLSRQKIGYLKGLAIATQEGKLDSAQLQNMSDREVRYILTQIRGIGPWTANMFLMFYLAREDVFAPRDHGLHTAICAVYDRQYPLPLPTRNEIAANWKPYRTYASLYLWHWQDSEQPGWES